MLDASPSVILRFSAKNLCSSYAFPTLGLLFAIVTKKARNILIPGPWLAADWRVALHLLFPRLHQLEAVSSHRDDVAMVRIESSDPSP